MELGMGMNFMRIGLQPMGMELKLMGMRWGQGNFYGDGVGMVSVHYRVTV